MVTIKYNCNGKKNNDNKSDRIKQYKNNDSYMNK